MAEAVYCWRCDCVVPMLNEQEWAAMLPLLSNFIDQIQAHRKEHQCSLAEALRIAPGTQALSKYAEITGFVETNVNAIWHHRVSIYGPPCAACDKPLRTPRASFCAACGTVRA